MQALLATGYEGKIKLIYIDPPFWTGENYYSNIVIGGETITKSPSVIERIAYKDYWEGGIDSYLDMLYPRLQLMKRLLTDSGSIYVHTDYHVGHFVKILMDEVFGRENFRNEISARRKIKNLQNQFESVRQLNVAFDSILWYSKNPQSRFRLPTKKVELRKSDQWNNFFNNADRPTLRYPFLGITLKTGQWRWERPKAEEAAKNYKEYLENYASKMTLYEYWVMTGKSKRFIKREPQATRAYYWVEPKETAPFDSDWTDVFSYDISPGAYPTQKSVEILRRILESGSEKGDLVADFFCGSGTTMIAAEAMERKWIGCDFSKVALQVARARLVGSESKPFLLENIGNYQRQLIYLSGSRIYEIQPVVLKLYGATPRKDFTDLGTRRQEGVEELVYVSYPDRPVSARKVGELEALAERLDGSGYKRLVILGWDYEYNFDELLAEIKRNSKRVWRSEVIAKAIPPEVYEYLKKSKSEEEIESLVGKVKFYDKPFLKLSRPAVQWRKDTADVTISLERYVVFDYPIEDQDQRKELEELLVDNPLALIDYWAVDWNYDGVTFRSSWQAVREAGRKSIPVAKSATQSMARGRKYDVAIRAVDVFGNDASKIIEVDLGRKR